MKTPTVKCWAIFLVVGAGACTSPPEMPLGTISSEAAQKLILERDDARDAAAAEARRYEAQIQDLRAEVADLRSQLGLAQETADEAADRAARYEEGLGKAVDRLNEVSQEASQAKVAAAAARAVAQYRPAPRAAAQPSADISYFTDPHLSIAENSIVASGRFWNSGHAEAIGTLYLDLVRNGEVISTAEERIRVNQRSWGSWQHEFHFTPNGSNVNVVPRFEPD